MTAAECIEEYEKQKITQFTSLLDYIDPDLPYREWPYVLKQIFYETDGSDDGFDLADFWSCGGNNKYVSTEDVRSMWRCFEHNHPQPSEVDEGVPDGQNGPY